MRVLTIAFVGIDQKGVHRKLSEQYRELRRHVTEVRSIVFADVAENICMQQNEYEIIHISGGGFTAAGRVEAFDICRKIIADFTPDIIYFRYPVYDSNVYDFVKDSPPVVFEIQTKYDREVPEYAAAIEREWAAKVLPVAGGIVAVTPEILEWERSRTSSPLFGHVMSNGADPNTLPMVEPNLNNELVEMVCAASFYPWHGIDRLLAGMALDASVDNVHLHLIGDGDMLPFLKDMASELNLMNRVHFHGKKNAEEIEDWYAKAHLAIGSLAPHRVGLKELSALKHREYAFKALPMLIAGGDTDFKGNLTWLKILDASDEPVNIRSIRSHALAWTNTRRRKIIRSWAIDHLSWSVKIPQLVSFLGECANRYELAK